VFKRGLWGGVEVRTLVYVKDFQLIGAFPKLREATISFVLYALPSAWNNSTNTGRIFMKFDIWVFLENLSRKFEFH